LRRRPPAPSFRTPPLNGLLTRLLAGLLAAAMVLSACATLPAGQLEGDARAIEVPARFHGDHVFVPVRIDGSTPLWYLLDSGAQMTILDATSAREVGIVAAGTSQLEGIGGTAAGAGITPEPVAIHLHGTEAYRLTRPVADLSGVQASLGTPLHGILGYDLFLRFVVEIDYAGGRVVLHDARSFTARPDDLRLDMEVDRSRPFVRGTIVLADGREASGRFLIDTGSDDALHLYSPFVQRHAVLDALPATITANVVGVGGELHARHGRLRALRLGPFVLDQPVATLSVAPPGLTAAADAAGHIGAEVLRRFTVTIDSRRGALYLRPNPRLAEPFEESMSGLGLIAYGADLREYRVHRVEPGSPAEHAGVRAGDLILEVDGRPADSITLAALRELNRSGPGRTVRLTVRRDGDTHALEIRLRRRI
jgi:hypothetical protein